MPSRRNDRPPIWIAPFEHRRHRPAGAAQIDEQFLRKRRAVAADQHGGARAAKGGCRRGHRTCARLLVQRLHAAPQRGRRNQPDQQCRQLHRMPPPMAQQHRERPGARFMRSAPACRLTWRSSVAASRALCVTIRKPQPVRVDQIARQRQHLVRGRLVEIAGRLVREQQQRSCCASARPIATRCCWPPDNCSG